MARLNASASRSRERGKTLNEFFHKFPHTPHLVWLGEGSPREDKILSRAEAVAFLDGEVVVEEKVDGANMGLSVGPDARLRAQSRGNYLNPSRCHAQWKPLWPWLARKEDMLINALGTDLMLFGEWCYAQHTVPYDALPDWFLAFDVFEPMTGRFWSSLRRDQLLDQIGILPVFEKIRGQVAFTRASKLIGKSAVGSGPAEGVYLRREDDDYLIQRAKIVGSSFRQQIEEHWTRKPFVPNKLKSKAPVF
jgi:ATP-dependent RNA circularization protein (DNA/RNA ligase family)